MTLQPTPTRRTGQRTEVVSVLLTPWTKGQLRQDAARNGVSMSAFLAAKLESRYGAEPAAPAAAATNKTPLRERP